MSIKGPKRSKHSFGAQSATFQPSQVLISQLVCRMFSTGVAFSGNFSSVNVEKGSLEDNFSRNIYLSKVNCNEQSMLLSGRVGSCV